MPAKNLSGKQPERTDDGRKFRQIGKFWRFEKQIASRGGKKHGYKVSSARRSDCHSDRRKFFNHSSGNST